MDGPPWMSLGDLKLKDSLSELVLVAHTYNPSYLGGRDQEDHSSKPAQANSW
jgi:hypothetical protein